MQRGGPRKDIRRKRSCVNQMLARAEIDSSYKPARKLWARMRNGHDLSNPGMQLRRSGGWRPVYDALALDWIDRGSGTESGRPHRWRAWSID